MLTITYVALTERAVVFEDGLPTRALAPGRHFIWGFGIEVTKFFTSSLVFDAPPEVRAVLPADWFDEVSIGAHERAIISKDGKPQSYLRPGVHRFWTIDPSVKAQVMSVYEPMPPVTDELMEIIDDDEYVDELVLPFEKALHFVDGELKGVLGPGRYTMWQGSDHEVIIHHVDMRRQEIQLQGQELMTRDKVTLRLNLAVEYFVVDPARVYAKTANVRDALYLAVQLATRDFVAGVTLDDLLGAREQITHYLAETTATAAGDLGVRIERVGLKDVVLPGDMKVLLNRVIEAEKEAAANVILRREETAATRSLANTAKVMADNPTLLRLKELESLKEIAGEIGEVRLVIGSDGLDKLAASHLLGGGK